MPTLAVLGAGPKGIAIAAKARALEAAGLDAPRVVLIDPGAVAAGLRPPLHLPVVAGLAQGPGFPNLSCLGLLSDRVLRRYVSPPEPAHTAQERRERV